MLPSGVIKEYLHTKFPVNKVLGQEFTTNSIFAQDEKFHMSINMDTGLWQDFKSQETGNFPQLIAAVEQIPYDQALSYLRSKLFDTPEHLFAISSVRVENQKPVSNQNLKKIVSSFSPFNPDDINKESLSDRLARKFVLSRKLSKFTFYTSKSGRYANRIIIPYTHTGRISDSYYFQARNLSVMGVKYLNPSREVTGIKSSEVLFPYRQDCDYIFITEGPIDAISLQVNGINATCTQGSHLSHLQAESLKDKQIIFAYDNDTAGAEGVKHARRTLLRKNKNEFCAACPPSGFKDWNDLHIECSSQDEFISKVRASIRTVDFEYDITEALG